MYTETRLRVCFIANIWNRPAASLTVDVKHSLTAKKKVNLFPCTKLRVLTAGTCMDPRFIYLLFVQFGPVILLVQRVPKHESNKVLCTLDKFNVVQVRHIAFLTQMQVNFI